MLERGGWRACGGGAEGRGVTGARGRVGSENRSPHTNMLVLCVCNAMQLGHFLHEAGRDYVTFERGAHAATSFQKFPINRVLNSINRRQTYARHDVPNYLPRAQQSHSYLCNHRCSRMLLPSVECAPLKIPSLTFGTITTHSWETTCLGITTPVKCSCLLGHHV